MSQEKLAELSKLHPTYISNIEQGKVNASIYSFYSVANALNIPFDELVRVGKTNKEADAEITVLLSLIRNLDKKKQFIFLSASKGLISGIEKVE